MVSSPNMHGQKTKKLKNWNDCKVSDALSDSVRIAIHFFVNFYIFKWLYLSTWKLAWLTPNLGILWISVSSFWLCESIVANPIIYRLVPMTFTVWNQAIMTIKCLTHWLLELFVKKAFFAHYSGMPRNQNLRLHAFRFFFSVFLFSPFLFFLLQWLTSSIGLACG